jgi:hypothetical protein
MIGQLNIPEGKNNKLLIQQLLEKQKKKLRNGSVLEYLNG